MHSLLVVFFFLCAELAALPVIYVNVKSTDVGQDGASWAHAYTSLQKALTVAKQQGASKDSLIGQIWVAKGTYEPSDRNPNARFELVGGWEVFGGFDGHENSLSQRNIARNESILCGKLPMGPKAEHLLIGSSNATLDGFTVRDSFGLLNDATTPKIRNCRFYQCSPAVSTKGLSPTFVHCVFDECHSAVIAEGAQKLSFTDCLFTKNARERGGAALHLSQGSSPLLAFCSFRDNTSDDGAAVFLDAGLSNDPLFFGCEFFGNRSKYGPEDIFSWHENGATFKECTFNATTQTTGFGFVTDRAPSYSPIKPLGSPVKPNPFSQIRLDPMPIVYVDASNTGGEMDGSSWQKAFSSLQKAIDRAWMGHIPAQVWVKAGTYVPEAHSFVLRSAVDIYGGFAGNEADLFQRKPSENKTIFSGDSTACTHVCIGAEDCTLDGVTIRGGKALGEGYDGHGGGLITYFRSPQSTPATNPLVSCGYSMRIQNCVFEENEAKAGGAVYSYDASELFVENCIFKNNRADYGGALVNRANATATYKKCTFQNNTARYGGGVFTGDCGAKTRFFQCLFLENTALKKGGALLTRAFGSPSHTILDACTLEKNNSSLGGAIANDDHSTVEMRSCIFTSNSAAIANNVFTSNGATSSEK